MQLTITEFNKFIETQKWLWKSVWQTKKLIIIGSTEGKRQRQGNHYFTSITGDSNN